MQIVNLKIKMSRFGICSTDSPKSKAIYVPIAFISYKGNKPTKKEVYLQAPSLSNKNAFKACVIGLNFFVVQFNNDNCIYDLEGRFRSNLSVEQFGTPVDIFNDTLCCLKGNIVSCFKEDGTLVNRKELFEDELLKFGWKTKR